MKKVILGVLLFASTAAMSGEQKKFKVGVENINYLPYYGVDKEEYAGFAKELLDAFAKSAGIAFDYKMLPVSRLFQKYVSKDSDLDFKFPDHESWAIEMKKSFDVKYSADVVEYIDGTQVLPGKTGKGQAAIKSIGTVRGFFTAWDDKKEIVKVIENDSITGLIQQGLLGRVDAAYVNIKVAQYILKNDLHKAEGLIYDASLPHSQGSYKFSSIKHPDLIAKFNEFMIKNKSELATIKKKWGV